MKRRVLLLIVLVSALAFSLATTSSTIAEPIEWKAQTSFPPEDAGTVNSAGALVKATNEALKGKLHTTLYQLGQLVPEEEMGPALSKGVYDAAYMPGMARSEAGNIAFGLPQSWDSIDQVVEFYYDYGFIEWIRKHEAKQNVYFGCPLPFGPVTLFSNFPLRTMDDYRGKKVWSWGLMSGVIAAFGAKPVWLDPGEVYMALKLGTIDGILFGPAELETMKLKEVVKYISFPAMLDPLVMDWCMNLESWNKLPPDVQETYEKTMRDLVVPSFEACMRENNKGLEAAKAYGVEVIDLEAAEAQKFRTTARKIWDRQAEKGPVSAEAVQMLREFLASKDN